MIKDGKEIYEIWLGTFEGEDFVWETLKEFDEYDDAYKFYKDLSIKYLHMTDEQLLKDLGSTRLDIELRKGESRLNWCGLYAKID